MKLKEYLDEQARMSAIYDAEEQERAKYISYADYICEDGRKWEDLSTVEYLKETWPALLMILFIIVVLWMVIGGMLLEMMGFI